MMQSARTWSVSLVAGALLTSTLAAAAPASSHEGMVFIPGGEFTMGSEEPMFADARPLHRVRVKSFWIDADLTPIFSATGR
jgi:sulfatase modifying factor 1